MTTAKLDAPPRGHLFRISRAKHTPEALTLMPCDLACLLNLSPSGVYDRDHQLRPAMLGLGSRKTRRYSWAKYLAYLAIVDGPPAGD